MKLERIWERSQFFLATSDRGQVVFYRDEPLVVCIAGIWYRPKNEFRVWPGTIRKRMNWFFHERCPNAQFKYVEVAKMTELVDEV